MRHAHPLFLSVCLSVCLSVSLSLSVSVSLSVSLSLCLSLCLSLPPPRPQTNTHSHYLLSVCGRVSMCSFVCALSGKPGECRRETTSTILRTPLRPPRVLHRFPQHAPLVAMTPLKPKVQIIARVSHWPGDNSRITGISAEGALRLFTAFWLSL